VADEVCQLAALLNQIAKIQLRCDHGRIASSVSQRHRVVSPMEATRPRPMTSRRISGRLQRDSGTSD
jgi:hypothetical protein